MNVLLSIKPKFVERIFDGEKKYEYRKIMFANGNVKNIFVYASTPVKKIVGRIEIDEVLCEAPSMLWNLTADHAGIAIRLSPLKSNLPNGIMNRLILTI